MAVTNVQHETLEREAVMNVAHNFGTKASWKTDMENARLYKIAFRERCKLE